MIKSIPTNLRESDRIENELRNLILTLELEPGLAVSEATLIKKYNWGRTPLREAFQRLSEQSLLKIIPHQGIVITPLNIFDFVEVMDAMSMVIGPAAMLACRNMDAEKLRKLESIIQEAHNINTDDNYEIFAGLDLAFHKEIADSCGNHYLSSYLSHLHLVASRFNLAAWKRDRNVKPSQEEHQVLVNLFRNGDAEAVEKAMLEHIENARQRIMGKMK